MAKVTQKFQIFLVSHAASLNHFSFERSSGVRGQLLLARLGNERADVARLRYNFFHKGSW